MSYVSMVRCFEADRYDRWVARIATCILVLSGAISVVTLGALFTAVVG